MEILTFYLQKSDIRSVVRTVTTAHDTKAVLQSHTSICCDHTSITCVATTGGKIGKASFTVDLLILLVLLIVTGCYRLLPVVTGCY